MRATGAEQPRPSGPMNERFTSRDRVAGKDGHAGRVRDQRPVEPKATPGPEERRNTHAPTKRGVRERDARPERPSPTRRR